MKGYRVKFMGSFEQPLSKARKTTRVMPQQLFNTLNNLVKDELTAVATYMHQASVVSGLGYQELGNHFWQEVQEETHHAMKLMDRINMFNRVPVVAPSPPVRGKDDVLGMLKEQMRLEMGALSAYNSAVKLARTLGDHDTQSMLEEILHDEEGHYDWLQTQLDRIDQEGLANYLTTQQGDGVPPWQKD